MRIVVDAREAVCGIARMLAAVWDDVEVRRLAIGDFVVGPRVLIERKTAVDFLASAANGRLIRQVARVAARAARPVLLLEGDDALLEAEMDAGTLRGIRLAITVGFRMPILKTTDLADTASCIRHIAAQESRREARRRRNMRDHGGGGATGGRVAPETLELLCALPGVGPERARAIAARAGSLYELCRLGVHDLLQVPGVGPDTAARIVDALRGAAATQAESDTRPRRPRPPERRGGSTDG